MKNELDLVSIKDRVVELTRSVGQFMRTEFEAFSKETIEYKGTNDMVSYVDKEAERLLVKGLTKILPEAGFLTEEETVARDTNKELIWIIDPLDGTTNFVHGIPVFSTSVALVKGSEVLIGVVNEVVREETFHAAKGFGAYLNDKSISVSAVSEMKNGLFATGFPYHDFERLENFKAIMTDVLLGSHGLRRIGSAAVDLVYTACGRVEGFFESGLNPWDIAGGVLIVQEAGGTVSDYRGGKDYLFGREVLAACGVHEELLGLIKRHW